MSREIKVQGFSHLVRDMNSNAVVNTNSSEYSLYIKRFRAREEQNDVLRNTVKEINSLKQELYEIRKILKGITNN
jgi:hypothetical protein